MTFLTEIKREGRRLASEVKADSWEDAERMLMENEKIVGVLEEVIPVDEAQVGYLIARAKKGE